MGTNKMLVNFFKMNGLGNDFVIIEDYADIIKLNEDQIRELANRKTGIGFDQLVILRSSLLHPCRMEIFNADGSGSNVCINATRCVAGLLMERFGMMYIEFDSAAGLIKAFKLSDKMISLIVGRASFEPELIPVKEGIDNMAIDFAIKNLPVALPKGVALTVGNPHVIFFTDDLEKYNLAEIGPIIENHEYFPARANVSFARVIAPDKIIVKTWERGTGETLACGSAAAATSAAAVKLELSNSRVFTIFMPGGELSVEVLLEYYLKVSGAYEISFSGLVEIKC
jgi:diaminopimelate epimerase